MIEQAYDRDSVRQYVAAVRGVVGTDPLRAATAAAAQVIPGAGDPQAKVSAALPVPATAQPSSGGAESTVVPYLSRDPAVSLVQSAVSGALREQGVADRTPLDRSLWSTITHTAEALLHPGTFSPADPDWVIKIARSMLGHLARGNHPFNPRPAEYAISDSARLVVVGDWGTGLPRARAVASYMAEEVADALARGREAHVIHLGDVYYSGVPSEIRQHVLACWPVTPEQQAFYVDLFQKVTQTPEYKDYMEKQALKPIFLTGKDMLEFLEEDDKLNTSLMNEAGFVAK